MELVGGTPWIENEEESMDFEDVGCGWAEESFFDSVREETKVEADPTAMWEKWACSLEWAFGPFIYRVYIYI